jgi:hypothetical protein
LKDLKSKNNLSGKAKRFFPDGRQDGPMNETEDKALNAKKKKLAGIRATRIKEQRERNEYFDLLKINNYILYPTTFKIKMINKLTQAREVKKFPKSEIEICCTSRILFSVCPEQLSVISIFVNGVESLFTLKKHYSIRPSVSPKTNGQEWFKYAIKSV